uniref:Uncharacterized protein n=1 Tax=Oryza sativa subsp. japonica TaxID=39947 RepID=Q67VM6_ORYSJ|nr:hypothetical protein [Oryza sativa Japonica Group]
MATMNSTNLTLVRTFAVLQQVRMFQVVVALVLFSLEPFMLLKQERCISGSSYLVLQYQIPKKQVASRAIHVDRTYDARSDIEPPSFNLGITQDIEEANMVACTPGHDISNVAEDSDKEQELNFLARYQQTKLSSFSPYSMLKETSGARIFMREEYACTKLPPKSKRRIIGGPSDILFDRPKRSIKPSHSVKSPFLSKQHSFVRHDQKALDDLYTYAISITDAEALNLHDIQQAIRLDTQMQEETFNVAVQVLAADEIQRFGGTDFVCWRHFLNQDFADQRDLRKEFLSNLLSFKGNEAILPDFVVHCLKLSNKI